MNRLTYVCLFRRKHYSLRLTLVVAYYSSINIAAQETVVYQYEYCISNVPVRLLSFF